jgi:hypothetical protein
LSLSKAAVSYTTNSEQVAELEKKDVTIEMYELTYNLEDLTSEKAINTAKIIHDQKSDLSTD